MKLTKVSACKKEDEGWKRRRTIRWSKGENENWVKRGEKEIDHDRKK